MSSHPNILTRHPTSLLLRTTVRASRNFEGLAWVSYDTNFRRQAVNQKSWDWDNIDPAMFNKAFCSRAKLKPRCKHWLSDQHEFQNCPLVPPTTVEVRQPRAGFRPLGNCKATIMLSCVVYLINQWPTNVDTQIASMPLFVPCAIMALIQHHSAQGPVTLLALPPQTVTPRITLRL